MTDQKPQTAPGTPHPTGEKNQLANQPSSDVATSRTEIDKPASCNNNCKTSRERKHWLDYATAAFALIAAIGGVGAGIAGAYQGWVARDGEIVANRAVLVLNSWSAVTYNDTTSKEREWQITPLIENTGNTPTVNFRYLSNMGLCIGQIPPKNVLDKEIEWNKRTDDNFSRNIIGPKSSIATQFLSLANSRIDCPWTGSAAGVVKFEDIFGNPHLVEFCTLVRFPNIDFQSYPIGQPIRIQGIACSYHNCSDDECGVDWRERATN